MFPRLRKSFPGKWSKTIQHVQSARLVWSFFSALLLLSFLYRWIVCHTLYSRPDAVSGIFLFFGKTIPISELWRFLFRDLIVAVMGAGALFLSSRQLSRLKKIQGGTPVAGLLFADAILLLCGLVFLAHYHLLFELNTGITLSLLDQASEELGLRDFLGMIGVADWVCMLVPVVVFHLVYKLFPLIRRSLFIGLGAAVSLILLLQAPAPPKEEIHWAVMENPLRIAFSVIRSGFTKAKNPYLLRKDLPSARQMNSIALVDSLFSGPRESLTGFPRTGVSKKYNVLFLVLETTGADYVFDESLCGSVPMPFVEQLSKKGLFLQNHYSTSPSSTRANFSLYTGLFPNPEPTDFSYSPRNYLPTFNKFLGPDYKSFLVTPIRTTFCYPKAMMKHNGWDISDYDDIPSPSHKREQLVQNELDAVTYLLEKIDKTPEPFCGLYVSYLSHWPYTDYGEAYRICPGEGAKASQQKYYNNLYTMDRQIRRMVDHLAQTGKLEHTVIVIVGDHGEGFGQHSGYIGHSHGTFGEVYRAPALFYQPDLFKPQAVHWLTSHVDVVPTLLDALGLDFDPDKFQGESILRGEPKRKYVFGVTAHECVMALDKSGAKISLSMRDPESWAYDTASDPKELSKQPVEKFPEQLKALIQFHNFQPQMLQRHNWQFRPK